MQFDIWGTNKIRMGICIFTVGKSLFPTDVMGCTFIS